MNDLRIYCYLIESSQRNQDRRIDVYSIFVLFLFVESSAVSFSHMKKFKHITCSEQYTYEYI